MSYAKVIDAALQLFPKKIKVTLINGVTGSKIGKHKIGLNQLPAAFNKPVTLQIDGQVWRVIQAEPVLADDFAIFKKLSLHVLDNEQLQQAQIHYNIPTQSAGLPAITTTPLYNDFSIDISADDWLQLQFLPASALPVIQEEITQIETVLRQASSGNPLLGYETPYVRSQIQPLVLDIPLTEFCESIAVQKMGCIRWVNNGGHEIRGSHRMHFSETGFVENGFALQSDNYVYYGTVINGRITHLGLTAFDCIDDEFFQLSTANNLLLADWCGARIVMCNEPGEASEAQVDDRLDSNKTLL
jgi:hypothetical protein